MLLPIEEAAINSGLPSDLVFELDSGFQAESPDCVFSVFFWISGPEGSQHCDLGGFSDSSAVEVIVAWGLMVAF